MRAWQGLMALIFLLCSLPSAAVTCRFDDLRRQYPSLCATQRAPRPMTDADARALFAKVQEGMSRAILQGRSKEALSSEEKSLLTRIETVEFAGFKKCDPAQPGRPAIDASYTAGSHSVQFCDDLRLFPLLTLISMMGHEIGHSSDSCNCQSAHAHVPERSRLRVPSVRLQSESDLSHFNRTMLMSRGPMNFVATPLMADRDLFESWRNQGLIEVRADAIPLGRYPLNRMRLCLGNKEGLWRAETSETLATDRVSAPGCNDSADYESLADVWGAMAVGQYLEDNPGVRGAAVLQFLQGRAGEMCSAKGSLTHQKRVDAIWLAHPQIAASIGCRPAPEHSCFEHNPFLRGRSQQPATGVARPPATR